MQDWPPSRVIPTYREDPLAPPEIWGILVNGDMWLRDREGVVWSFWREDMEGYCVTCPNYEVRPIPDDVLPSVPLALMALMGYEWLRKRRR